MLSKKLIQFIYTVMTLRIIHNRENLVFLGPQVAGKTHLSAALGINDNDSGISIYCTTAVNIRGDSYRLKERKRTGNIGRIEVKRE